MRRVLRVLAEKVVLIADRRSFALSIGVAFASHSRGLASVPSLVCGAAQDMFFKVAFTPPGKAAATAASDASGPKYCLVVFADLELESRS